MRVGVVGPDLHRLLVLPDRLGPLALILQQHRQVEVRPGEIPRVEIPRGDVGGPDSNRLGRILRRGQNVHDPLGVPSRLRQSPFLHGKLRQHGLGGDQPGPGLDDLEQVLLRPLTVILRHRATHLHEQLVRRDEILGVFPLRVEGGTGGHRATDHVSQASQPLHGGEVDRRWLATGRGGFHVPQFRLQPPPKPPGHGGRLLDEIVPLRRIARQVVELLPGRPDVLPRALHHAVQRPAVVGGRPERLTIDRPRRVGGALAGQTAPKAPPLDLPRRFQPGQIQHGWHDVHEADVPGHLQALGPTRRPDNQRHVHRALIHEESVRGLAVFAQAFPVVAGDNHQRVVVEPHRPQLVQHLPDAVIHVGDLPGVQVVGIVRRPGHRRLVRRMSVVIVQEQKKRLPGVLLQPWQRRRVDLLARSLVGRHFREPLPGVPAIVRVEALVQPEPPV